MSTATVPVCPKHNTKMLPSKFDEGGFYCPSQDPSEEKGRCTQSVRGSGKKPAQVDAPAQTTALAAPLPPMPPWLAKPLEQFAGNPGFELILPSVPVNAEIGYGHRVAVSVVQISANPDEKEVFQVGTRNGEKVFAYSKPALEKMAEAAGIQIRTERKDDRRDPEYAEVQAIAGMKGSNGQAIIRTATKAFRMADVRAEALRNRMKLRGEDEATASQAVAAEMTAFQKHLLARTESGAMLRAIRSLLAIKSGLTAAQVAKPKVLVRVEFNPDTNDPVVKRFMLEKGYEATSALYLPQPGTRHIDVAEVEDDIDDEPDSIMESVRLPQEPLNLGSAPVEHEIPSDEASLHRDIEKGAEILGLSEAQLGDVVRKHRGATDSRIGDLQAALKDINAQVDAKNAGGRA